MVYSKIYVAYTATVEQGTVPAAAVAEDLAAAADEDCTRTKCNQPIIQTAVDTDNTSRTTSHIDINITELTS